MNNAVDTLCVLRRRRTETSRQAVMAITLQSMLHRETFEIFVEMNKHEVLGRREKPFRRRRANGQLRQNVLAKIKTTQKKKIDNEVFSTIGNQRLPVTLFICSLLYSFAHLASLWPNVLLGSQSI